MLHLILGISIINKMRINISKKITTFSVDHPKIVIAITLAVVLLLGLQIPRIKVDTDPENMLSEEEFVRVFHNEVKKEFSLYDFIILGIVNDKNPNGVFNVPTLSKIYEITDKIKNIDGVMAHDLISPSTTDNIRQAGPGTVRFEWLMAEPPASEAEALDIMTQARNNPMLDGTLVSEDGKALCIYVPIKKKDISYRVSGEILDIVAGFSGDEKYYITGLPVAEDTFGVEMFKQMAMSAPLAGLIIFMLMWIFFRKISLIISPMAVAGLSVISTMGILIGKGYTVHIMSSMIPIFLMPIAVVDSVHILSEFFDRYQSIGDKKKTILAVMDHLFVPMLYTSLTTTVGFASLAFTPIPPVQIFGIFVALGVMIAWALTITFVPACTMLIREKSLKKFGVQTGKEEVSLSGGFLQRMGAISTQRARVVLGITVVIIAVSIFGVTRIEINDNPVKWFAKSHRIRVADKVLNEHFGGTYTAYLIFTSKEKDREVFKQPDMLRYIENLQVYLKNSSLVGKSTSLADAVKKVYYELMGGDKIYNVIPKTSRAVAQCLMSFQNSHRPDDLWHLTNPDYSKINIWVQLKSGDNRDMSRVVKDVEKFIADNQLPFEVETNWAGLTFINTVWQDKMVFGMLKSLLGSFIIVFIMMILLFRSPVWGFLSMIPLSVTILLIYGLIGIVGKDYDMPVAILSSLTLGLSIDFAIHFLQRMRSIYQDNKSWPDTVKIMFEEPARAISRNALIISIGFLPLLLSTLIPYRTVGFFLAAIMAVSCAATLLILPSIITVISGRVFAEKKKLSKE